MLKRLSQWSTRTRSMMSLAPTSHCSTSYLWTTSTLALITMPTTYICRALIWSPTSKWPTGFAESVVSDKPSPREVVYSTKNTDIDTHSHKDNTHGFAPSLALASRPLVLHLSLSKSKSIHRSQRVVFIKELSPRGSLSSQVCSRKPCSRKAACCHRNH